MPFNFCDNVLQPALYITHCAIGNTFNAFQNNWTGKIYKHTLVNNYNNFLNTSFRGDLYFGLFTASLFTHMKE